MIEIKKLLNILHHAITFLNLTLFVLIIFLSKINSFNIEERKFSVFNYNQKVDHFNYNNFDTYPQRIIISKQHWCGEGCPIFFYTGNEGDIFVFANNTGFMWENAPKFKAMVVFAEHRYYGKSIPYGDKGFNDLKHLGYLSSEQALADFAQFIQYLKYDLEPKAAKSPVIVMGGSYGGMLSAWFRMKYPHLAIGALAASAPVLQFPKMYNCSKFTRIITKDFRDYSIQCSESVRKSWPAFRRVAQQSNGLEWITKTFHLCKPLENIEALFAWLEDTYENLAMTDYPNPASFLAPLPAYPIKEVCKHLRNSTEDDKKLIFNIYNAISVFYNYTGKTFCNDISEQNSSIGASGWAFQSCTEMLMPVCSDNVHDMFEKSEWDMNQIKENCHQTYKVNIDPYKIQMLFGGENLIAASNIIFSNGDRDPWSAGGVLKNISHTVISLMIPHACHHEDLRETGPNDPPQLKAVRETEKQIIKRWINEYYEENKMSMRINEI